MKNGTVKQVEARTLKGFRDFLPRQARKRQYVKNALKKVFQLYGFEPLETPILEYEEILAGKYGEEGDKLMYRFEDKGGRRVAMRYDQTVPLARVAAQYKNDIPLPFKRYQISNVFRGENTQAGRFREFTQCDIDTVGTPSLFADAEIIACAAKCLDILGFKKYKILINDRRLLKMSEKTSLWEWFNLDNMSPAELERQDTIIIRALDKLKKNGEDGVVKEITTLTRYSEDQAKQIIKEFREAEATENLKRVFGFLESLGISNGSFEFSPTLARGLDYYTGTIFEIEVEGYAAGSVCGGGRYDNLVGIFSSEQIPAVGCAFGFDRIIEAMEELNLFPDLTKVSTTRVLVTVFNQELLSESIKLFNYIQANGLNAEIYLSFDEKLDKQIKYADKKGIMYAAILGPEELKNKTLTIKNLRVNDQQTVAFDDLLKVI